METLGKAPAAEATQSFWSRLQDVRQTLKSDRSDRTRARSAALLRELHREAGATETRRDLLARFAALYDVPFAPEPCAAGPRLLQGEGAGLIPGISVVSCCKNRNDNLVQALPSWLARYEVSEIVVVDWSSDRPVAASLAEAGLADPRIRIVRVEDEPRWILSYAFNAGFRAARFAKVLKADADIVLDPGFFAANRLQRGRFVAGNWRTATTGQEYVNGFFFVHHADLMAVGGFNEHITTYGWDDDDLYERMVAAGIERIDVAAGTVHHLAHEDDARLAPADAPAAEGWAALSTDTKFRIRANRFIATIMPAWNGRSTMLPLRIEASEPGRMVLRRHGPPAHTVPGHIRRTAETLAALELLSWRTGPRALELTPDRLDRLLAARPFSRIDALHVELGLAGAPRKALGADRFLVGDARWGTSAPEPSMLATLRALAERSGRVLVLRGTFEPGAVPDGVLVIPDIGRIGTSAPIPPGDLDPDMRLPDAAVLHVPLKAAGPDRPAAPAVAPRRDRIFLDAQHGLGNRMRAIGSAASIAEKSGRELVIVWQPDHHCDCRLADLFDYDGAVVEESFVEDAARRGCAVYNYIEVEPDARKDAPVDLDGAGDVYARSAYVLNSPLSAWGDENRFLRGLRPVAAVRELVSAVRAPNDLSAHVRMASGRDYEHLPYESAENWTAEDHAEIARWREKSHFSHFMARIDALVAEGAADTVFLAADRPETYAEFEARYGDRVARLPRAVYDRSAEQLRYALADAILLGRAPRLLGSTWSSFSELAMRLAPQKMALEMSGKDF